jgi:hypothetical protein
MRNANPAFRSARPRSRNARSRCRNRRSRSPKYARGCAPGLPSATRAGQPLQRASRPEQPALPQRCGSPTPHATASISHSVQIPAAPEHSAGSSIGLYDACPPASVARAHAHSRGQASYKHIARLNWLFAGLLRGRSMCGRAHESDPFGATQPTRSVWIPLSSGRH